VSERDSRRGGPRTPQGKARTRLNAVKTGIFARLVLTGEPFRERQADFEELLAELRKSMRPRDSFEAILVENLTLQFLRLTRVYHADAAVAPQLFRSVGETLQSNGFDAIAANILKEGRFGDGKLPAADLLMRYEAGVWRQIDRIMDRLGQWRRGRDKVRSTTTPGGA
jgi:hypothetical protein